MEENLEKIFVLVTGFETRTISGKLGYQSQVKGYGLSDSNSIFKITCNNYFDDSIKIREDLLAGKMSILEVERSSICAIDTFPGLSREELDRISNFIKGREL